MPRRRERLAAEARKKQKAVDAFHARLDDLLLTGVELDDDAMARRVRNVTLAITARERRLKLDRLEKDVKGADEVDGAGGDVARRERLLARLAGLAAELEQKGADRCPACGRVEPDRDRLARLGASLSDPG
ncbi:hypothetical protein ACO2Q1_12385 [Brevundimonas sp. VNH65]|uniref:hypothetical protein n=1 Tax=Brevundimonas sp. VNH65 TaxID=3400917 RepID=UPI003C035E4C